MKSLEQELLEIDNFYANCTMDEANAFHSRTRAKAFRAMTKMFKQMNEKIRQAGLSIDKLKKKLKGIGRFFKAKKATVQVVRANVTVALIMQNRLVEVKKREPDEVRMEEVLIQAQQILIIKK